ncbi:hypothetical protein BRCON_2774 [Candidatus Sumerlaea chitinivorans]|uniref:Uncharacterized protein n=1 Tax=Sumerlaea chitinivorans TaxID=2250252 RepID=A0A2Z4Y905_SUMC1|nr:hypothetical protein BRCON_2774 [Candidatus Sumerlaea chitinivorans]
MHLTNRNIQRCSAFIVKCEKCRRPFALADLKRASAGLTCKSAFACTRTNFVA